MQASSQKHMAFCKLHFRLRLQLMLKHPRNAPKLMMATQAGAEAEAAAKARPN